MMQIIDNNRKANLNFYSIYSKNIGFHFDCVVGHDVIHKFPMHLHSDSLCLGLINRGQRNMLYSSLSKTYNEKDIFVINTNQPHAINQLQPHDYIAITIKGIKSDVYLENKIKSSVCVDLFIQLFHAIRDNDADLLRSRWNNLYNYLCCHYQMPSTHLSYKESVSRALDFIRNNYHNPISIDDIAKHACLSQYHFCRLFKEAVGLSPHNYLTQYRLSQSYDYLKSKQTIFDTAIDSGFYDSSHFIRTFYANMAVSPKQYQESIVEE